MKFLCLSHIDEEKFDVMSESARETFIKECFAYDNVLKRNGHFVRLEALQNAQNAKTLRYRNGYPSPTARTLKPKNKSAVFSCSMPSI